jgi:hypothetical protein
VHPVSAARPVAIDEGSLNDSRVYNCHNMKLRCQNPSLGTPVLKIALVYEPSESGLSTITSSDANDNSVAAMEDVAEVEENNVAAAAARTSPTVQGRDSPIFKNFS